MGRSAPAACWTLRPLLCGLSREISLRSVSRSLGVDVAGGVVHAAAGALVGPVAVGGHAVMVARAEEGGEHRVVLPRRAQLLGTVDERVAGDGRPTRGH